MNTYADGTDPVLHAIAEIRSFTVPADPLIPPFMQALLHVLQQAGEDEDHVRMRLVKSEDGLMEMAAAEVLAGVVFPGGPTLHTDQLALLNAPLDERIDQVRDVFSQTPIKYAIG